MTHMKYLFITHNLNQYTIINMIAIGNSVVFGQWEKTYADRESMPNTTQKEPGLHHLDI